MVSQLGKKHRPAKVALLALVLCFAFSSVHGANFDVDNAGAAAYSAGWGTNFPNWTLDGTVFTGTGFGSWNIRSDQYTVAAVESVRLLSTNPAVLALDSSGKSFRLSGGFQGPNSNGGYTPAYAKAERWIDPAGLSVGQTLSFQVAVKWRNGNKGFDLIGANDAVLFNFSVKNDDYLVENAASGFGSIGNSYSDDTIFTFLFVQTNSSGGTWKITRAGGVVSTNVGTYTGVPRRVDWFAGESSVNGTNDPLFFNNLVIGPATTLNLSVNMNAKIKKNAFNTTNHGLVMRGSFDWGSNGFPLTDTNGKGIYTASIVYPGTPGTNVEYRMFATGTGGLQWEDRLSAWRATGGSSGGSHNRSLSLTANGTSQDISIYFGDDDGDGPKITLNGANPLYLSVGSNFMDPGATAEDSAEGTTVNITGTGTVNTAVVGNYTVTYTASDAAGNPSAPVTRTVVVTANDGYDAFISGKTTNSQTLAEYAFGATDVGVLNSGNRPQVSVSGGNLVLTYNVRVTNPSLVVVPQLSTNLPSFAPDTSITTSTNGQTTNNGVVLEQRTASVPIDGPGRKFLRLQVQRGP